MQFDDIFDIAGSFGPFQVYAFLLIGVYAFWTNDANSSPFITFQLDHWCHVPALANLSMEQRKHIATPLDAHGNYHKCYRYDVDFASFTEEELAARNFSGAGTVACTSWDYDFTQYYSSAVNKFDLVCGREWLVSLSSTLYVLGGLLGAFSCGIISDKFGRKPALMLATTLMIVGGVLCAFAPNYALFGIGRLLGGCGRVASYACAICFVMEFMGKGIRSAVGLGFGIYFAAGYCIWPWMAKALKSDTYFQLCLVLPNILYYSYIWILPESPRWLLIKGRYEEAEKAIRWMASWNRKTIPDSFDIHSIEVDQEKKETKTIVDVFRGPILRKRIIVIFYIWFTVVLAYFAVVLNVNILPGDIYLTTFFLALMEFPGLIISIFVTNWSKMGRRGTGVAVFIGQGICGFICLPLLIYGYETPLLVMVLFARVLQSAAFGIIFFYTPELFPTEVRNTVTGAASTIGRVSGMMASFIGGPLGNVWAPLPNLIYGILGTSAGLLCLLLPETLGVKLHDTIDETEGRVRRKSQAELKDLPKSHDNEVA